MKAEWAEEKERERAREGLLERVEQLVTWHSCEVAHSKSKQSEIKAVLGGKCRSRASPGDHLRSRLGMGLNQSAAGSGGTEVSAERLGTRRRWVLTREGSAQSCYMHGSGEQCVWYVCFVKSMEEYVVPKWQGRRQSVSCLSVSVIDFMTIAEMIIMSARIYSR